MGNPTHITVEFAPSRKRSIDVKKESLYALQYEAPNNFKIHSKPTGGSIQTSLLLTFSVTFGILLVIALVVMLVING